MTIKLNKTVREIAIEHPASVRVFESLGIDYCCGGKRSLQEASQRANVSLDRLLDLLSAAEEQPLTEQANWAKAAIRDLVRHIVEQHHGYIRRESPRLISLLDKVVSRHRAGHKELKSIQDLFGAMLDELFAHMAKEENILFPYLVKTEQARSAGGTAPQAVFGSVEVPISRMLADHDDAGALTARIRALSGDFQTPDDACPTYVAVYRGLAEFERDLHHHVHLENNILFPRALAMERSFACAGNVCGRNEAADVHS